MSELKELKNTDPINQEADTLYNIDKITHYIDKKDSHAEYRNVMIFSNLFNLTKKSFIMLILIIILIFVLAKNDSIIDDTVNTMKGFWHSKDNNMSEFHEDDIEEEIEEDSEDSMEGYFAYIIRMIEKFIHSYFDPEKLDQLFDYAYDMNQLFADDVSPYNRSEASANGILMWIIDEKSKVDKQTNLYYYYSLCAIENFCYYMLNTSPYDEKWIEMINELEHYINSNNIADIHSQDKYSQIAPTLIYFSLARYFESFLFFDLNHDEADKINSNGIKKLPISIASTSDAILKMQNYGKLFMESCIKVMHDKGIRLRFIEDEITRIFYGIKLNAIYLQSELLPSTDHKNMISEIDDLINDCSLKLKNMEYSQESKVFYIRYIGLNLIIAKAAKLRYTIYENIKGTDVERDKELLNSANLCYAAAARMLKMHNIEDEFLIYEIAYACNAMIYVDKYEKNDVKSFYEMALKLLKTEKYVSRSTIAKKASIQYDICRCCKSILDKYGHDAEIYELGLKCVTELNKYLDIAIEDEDEERMRELYSYFKNYEKP